MLNCAEIGGSLNGGNGRAIFALPDNLCDIDQWPVRKKLISFFLSCEWG
jgi:hypothetical protein